MQIFTKSMYTKLLIQFTKDCENSIGGTRTPEMRMGISSKALCSYFGGFSIAHRIGMYAGAYMYKL